MIVFLEKVRVKTLFSIIDPVRVEPLELSYLKRVLNSMNIEAYIIDDLFGFRRPRGLKPDVVVLTGYNTAEKALIKKSQAYKDEFPRVKIIAGGVHVQENAQYFRVNSIDYVLHSGSLKTFELLMENIKNKAGFLLSQGLDTNIDSSWHLGVRKSISENEGIIPDRDFFKRARGKLKYIDKRKVALIKGSTGCPYKCSFCYCRLVNKGLYIRPDYKTMIEEMENIEADYFWIVDDVLFSSRQDALEFLELVEKKKVRLKIIGYLRADFICRERDLLKRLKEAGLTEVIVGFEATVNDQLKDYEKTTDAGDYPLAISLLKEHRIDLTALFMVRPDYNFKDFKILKNFIKANKLDCYTISIMTPIKGTRLYEEMQDSLIDKRPEKFDFLHLVLKPKLPKVIFYILFASLHLRLLKSKRIRNMGVRT